MKKVLLATTALAMSAGVAYAEVSVSGNARVGLQYDQSEATATTADSRVRMVFSAAGETDSGLSYSASMRIRTGNEAGASVNAFNELGVTISGAFGSLTFGTSSSAAELAVGDLAGVGYAGAGGGNENNFVATNLGQRLMYSYTTGGMSVFAGAGQLESDSYSVGASYSVNGLTVGAGYEDDGASTQAIASVAYAMGDTTIKAVYGKASIADTAAEAQSGGDFDDDGVWEAPVDAVDAASGMDTQMGLSVKHTMGAVTASAYYRTTEDNAGTTAKNMGLGVAYDLGGGATLGAGFADIDGNRRADLGINLSF